MSKIDEIMSDVQSFASTWALVGGRFDDGSMHNTAEAQSAELRNLIAAALDDAERKGAEAMREAAASAGFDAAASDENACEVMEAIEALPLPTGKRQAVLLTDAEVKQIGDATLYAGGIYDRVRAIETAVLAANGMEVRRG